MTGTPRRRKRSEIGLAARLARTIGPTILKIEDPARPEDRNPIRCAGGNSHGANCHCIPGFFRKGCRGCTLAQKCCGIARGIRVNSDAQLRRAVGGTNVDAHGTDRAARAGSGLEGLCHARSIGIRRAFYSCVAQKRSRRSMSLVQTGEGQGNQCGHGKYKSGAPTSDQYSR
jgi:hypothetical protein